MLTGFLPAAVGEQLRPAAPEQAGLRGGSRTTLDHHLPPSGCWDQSPHWIQPEVWSLNWKDKEAGWSQNNSTEEGKQTEER